MKKPSTGANCPLREQRDSGKTSGLGQAKRDVHRLDRLTGGAFAEVVDDTHRGDDAQGLIQRDVNDGPRGAGRKPTAAPTSGRASACSANTSGRSGYSKNTRRPSACQPASVTGRVGRTWTVATMPRTMGTRCGVNVTGTPKVASISGRWRCTPAMEYAETLSWTSQ